MKILILTKYDKLGASGRVRFFQYFEQIENKNISFTTCPFFDDYSLSFFYKTGKRRVLNVFFSYFRRFWYILISFKYDLIFIEKEVFPYLPSFFENILFYINKNYIVDFDDAIYLNYDNSNNLFVKFFLKNKLLRLLKNAQLITVGNQYLYNYFVKYNQKIKLLYSIVDDKKYIPFNTEKKDKLVIGWIGTPTTYKYLKSIENILIDICQKYPIKVIIIGAEDSSNKTFQFKKWILSEEIENINEFDIGIMPLFDTDWEKGKCGFKLLQYMACGKPVIASPVGINVDIVTPNVGFLAKNQVDWENAISVLIENEVMRRQFGFNARKRIEENFSFQTNLSFYNKILHNVN